MQGVKVGAEDRNKRELRNREKEGVPRHGGGGRILRKEQLKGYNRQRTDHKGYTAKMNSPLLQT